jgi:pimeloyl-ACP methyl ester carboxylesterase
MSYLNGSAHRSTERDSFSGRETRGQLDFLTRFYCNAPPDVLGRGMLAMFRYDATAILEHITVPALMVAGEHDKTCVPDASRYMASKIPNAELVILPNMRYCGLFEAHEQFHEAVIGFLASADTSKVLRRAATADVATGGNP